MMEPYWMTVEVCLALHERTLFQYGGRPGLRDAKLLESALAKPKQLFADGKPTLVELALSYIFGVIKNQPFIDGNQHTGLMLGIGFLEWNGSQFDPGEADACLQAWALQKSHAGEAEYLLQMVERTVHERAGAQFPAWSATN